MTNTNLHDADDEVCHTMKLFLFVAIQRYHSLDYTDKTKHVVFPFRCLKRVLFILLRALVFFLHTYSLLKSLLYIIE